jgi:hypothetical protein
MEVEQLISKAFNSLHLRDCVPPETCDVLMEDKMFDTIMDNEEKYSDNERIDKNLFKRVVYAVRLLTRESICPDVTKTDFIMFLRITKAFIDSVITSRIWIISSDSSMTKRNLICNIDTVNRYKISNMITLRTHIKNLEMIQVDNYIFDPIMVFDIFRNMNHSVPHGMFVSVMMKHYNKITKVIGYSNIKLRVKYQGKKYIMVEIIFNKKN